MSRVLITGCSTGIGRATAKHLTARGHVVIATARQVEALAGLDVALRLPLDVTDRGSIAEVVDAAGDVEVLVNNAGVLALGPVESFPIDEIRRLHETNVLGAVSMVQAFAPSMRARGHGTIVNVSSVAGRVVPPLMGAYSSTKFALEALSEAAALELGRFGVRVRVIQPGAVSSGALDDPVVHLDGAGPYAPLAGVGPGSDPASMISPEAVAEAIGDAIASDGPVLRWPVGPVTAILDARRSMDDETFAAMFRSRVAPSW
jgi:NAD(P)-dependent dehydrogenase (short-subunit alcohol dehydrogenase family)